ncbi:hypothetical protein CEXT_574211 [Caerostris extrusa]|uniref:Uncharacterized protein n=1 Tax=Caerostris extrusa TaxID=172846 RepID=A0AAV4PC44_CAEEX|nr:hypothetical protein CEXT_574211 [Caerostris extrusa]
MSGAKYSGVLSLHKILVYYRRWPSGSMFLFEEWNLTNWVELSDEYRFLNWPRLPKSPSERHFGSDVALTVLRSHLLNNRAL